MSILRGFELQYATKSRKRRRRRVELSKAVVCPIRASTLLYIIAFKVELPSEYRIPFAILSALKKSYVSRKNIKVNLSFKSSS